MNTKYMFVNGDAYTFDDKRRTVKRPLTDNLQEVLEQENKIELIKEEINKNDKKIFQQFKELEKDKKIATFAFPCLLLFTLLMSSGLIISVGAPLVFAKKLFVVLTTLLGGLAGLGWSFSGVLNYRNKKKNIKNIIMQNYFLKRDLESEKNYLKDLEEIAVPIEQERPSDLIVIHNKKMKKKLEVYKEKLNFYQKNINEFYQKPISEKFKNELYRNGIDADVYEDYVELQRRILKKQDRRR